MPYHRNICLNNSLPCVFSISARYRPVERWPHQHTMTTRWRQKASSALAIAGVIALLLLLIFLWTAVRNGVFSERPSTTTTTTGDGILSNRFEMNASNVVGGVGDKPAQHRFDGDTSTVRTAHDGE